MPPPRCRGDVPDNVRESCGDRERGPVIFCQLLTEISPFGCGHEQPMYRIIGHYPTAPPADRKAWNLRQYLAVCVENVGLAAVAGL